jgi:hypothetical protein
VPRVSGVRSRWVTVSNNLITDQLWQLAGTLADLKGRLRWAVAGDVGKAVAEAVAEVLAAVLSGRVAATAWAGWPARFDPYGSRRDPWADPDDPGWDPEYARLLPSTAARQEWSALSTCPRNRHLFPDVQQKAIERVFT